MTAMTPVLHMTPTRDLSTRLYGNRLTLARAAWGLIALLAIGINLLGLPSYYMQLKTPLHTAPMGLSVQILQQDAAGLARLGVSLEQYAAYMVALQSGGLVIFFALGIFIFLRESSDKMALLTTATMLLIGGFGQLSGPPQALAAANAAWNVPVHFLLALERVVALWFLAVFPDGKFVPRWTRWIVVAHGVWMLGAAFVPNSPLNIFSWPLIPHMIVAALIYNGAALAQVVRFRRAATIVERQQTKWAMLGISVATVVALAVPVLVLSILPTDLVSGLGRVVPSVIAQATITLGTLVFALSLGVSILRYRLWDVDLVINRSLVYGALTGILGAMFVALFVAVQSAFMLLSVGAQTPMALGVSAVVIGMAFQPTRRRL